MKNEEALDQIAYIRQLIQQTKLRAADGSPYFLLWGVLWAAGYLATAMVAVSALSVVWGVLGAVGSIASAVISIRIKRRAQSTPSLLRKIGWMSGALVITAVIGFALLMSQTTNLVIVSAYWPIQAGAIYVAVGIFLGREMIQIGSWLILTALVSLWLPASAQAYFLAATAGGGLFLTGILLRRRVTRVG